MYDIIPLFFILLGLSMACFIILKKFSILANLDVESIQSEKEARFKERILGERLKRNVLKLNFKFGKYLSPLLKKIESLFKIMYEKLVDVKEKHSLVKNTNEEVREDDIEDMFLKIEECLKNDEKAEAEAILLKIISANAKNIRAFRQLAKIYLEEKNYIEARQTFEHVLKLAEDRLGNHNVLKDEFDGDRDLENDALQAETYFYLSLVNRDMGNIDDAVKNIHNALKIEASNPRYLDTGLEISIMIKDKDWSEKMLEALKSSNPENNKIQEFAKRISEI